MVTASETADPATQRHMNRVKQEALGKASLIHKSGMPFYCAILEEPQGDLTATLAALDVINTPVKKPDGTNVRDISAVGKLLLSSNDNQLVVTAYVHKSRLVADKINAWDWIDLIMTEHGGTLVATSNETVASGVIANNPAKDVYVFKLRDTILQNEYEFLRVQGALPRAKDEDDDELLGDDVFDF